MIPFEVFDMIQTAVKELGYQNNVCYALDCASSEFYDEKEGAYHYRGRFVDRAEIIKVLVGLADKFPMAFIEDALQEEDFEGFKMLNERANTIVIGDDFICTSMDRAKEAVEMGAVRGMIFKPNQAGTLTEALQTAQYMKNQGMLVVPSGRAGGVLDSPEKELGVALGLLCIQKRRAQKRNAHQRHQLHHAHGGGIGYPHGRCEQDPAFQSHEAVTPF